MDKDYFSVYEKVVKFMLDNRITCGETVWQTDRVSENALDFIDGLFSSVARDRRIKEMIDAELD